MARRSIDDERATDGTTVYQNKVTLDFTGADADIRNQENGSLTTLSQAAKNSYRKDGKCISRAEECFFKNI